MTVPTYSEADIQQQASSESFQRGQAYCRDGAVASLVRRGATLTAAVWGSEDEPYRVVVTLADEKLGAANCTCPYDWGGWCKHIVAALLTAREQPEKVELRQPVAELLTGLSRDQLQAVLLKVIERDPAVAELVEAQVALLTQASAAPASAPGGQPRPARTSTDPEALRHEVRALLGLGGGRRSRIAYYDVGTAAGAMSDVVARARRLVTAGEGRAALAVLDVLVEEFWSAWQVLDDSSGESGDFFAELGEILTEALLTEDVEAHERAAWAPKLEAWQQELSNYGIDDVYEAALLAAKQGWDYPPLQRVLRGEITEQGAWDGEAPYNADALAEARLNVLDRQGRHQEYLYLAEAEGKSDRYVAMLARIGRGAEALDYARAHLRSVPAAFGLATALWERGEAEWALESAEFGLTLEGPKTGLAAWLRDRAAERGDTDRALAAATIAFAEQQSLADYRKIEELAGPDDWPARRAALLDQLRTVHTYNRHGPVEIFLHEGLIEDAIAVVDRGATHTLVEQVADAAIGSHPDWVITVSRQQAEGIMDSGKSQYYDSAAGWLARARDAYQATGRQEEWRAYLAGLLNRHGRKYSLVPLLKKL